MDLAGSLNVFVLCAASRDLESLWKHDSDRAAEEPACRVAMHRRSGGKGVCPLGEQRPVVRAGVMFFLKERLCEIDNYLIAHRSPA